MANVQPKNAAYLQPAERMPLDEKKRDSHGPVQHFNPIDVLPSANYDNTERIAQELRHDHPVRYLSGRLGPACGNLHCRKRSPPACEQYQRQQPKRWCGRRAHVPTQATDNQILQKRSLTP